MLINIACSVFIGFWYCLDSEQEEMLEKEEENEALMLQHALADRLDENDFDLKEFEVIFLLFEIFAELILSDDQT